MIKTKLVLSKESGVTKATLDPISCNWPSELSNDLDQKLVFLVLPESGDENLKLKILKFKSLTTPIIFFLTPETGVISNRGNIKVSYEHFVFNRANYFYESLFFEKLGVRESSHHFDRIVDEITTRCCLNDEVFVKVCTLRFNNPFVSFQLHKVQIDSHNKPDPKEYSFYSISRPAYL